MSTEPITAEELAAIEARMNAADAALTVYCNSDVDDLSAVDDEMNDVSEEFATATETLVTSSRDVPVLLAEVRSLRDSIHAILSGLRWTGDGYEWTGGEYDYRMKPEEAAGLMLADKRRLKEENAILSSGVTCFGCGAAYSPEIANGPCDSAHRETWPHEWINQRTREAISKNCELIATIERLKSGATDAPNPTEPQKQNEQQAKREPGATG